MGKFKFQVAMCMAKLSIPALKVTGHKGTDFPGILALKICPDFLKYIEKPAHIYGVTGTNGKTTISNLLTACITKLDKEPMNNGNGSNTITGVATSLIKGSTLTGKNKGQQTAVFEIDERSTRLICPYLTPEKLIVANLSRDSIMRTGHPQYVRDILSSFVPAETEIIANADDLNASSVAPSNRRVYYGIGRMEGDQTECTSHINDVALCPKCGEKLGFDYLKYSNIGKAKCAACGFTSPDCNYSATDVDFENKTLTFHTKDGSSAELDIINTGVFNIYNQVAVATLLSEIGYSLEEIRSAMQGTAFAKTRINEEASGDVLVSTMLCKGLNGYASSRVFEYIKSQPGQKEIVIMTNSLDAEIEWSEDVCWIYDSDFENLATDELSQIIVHGDRGLDYKLRLLLAGVSEEKITVVGKPEDSLDHLKLTKGETVYVLYDLDVIDRGMTLADSIREKCKEA